MADMDCPNCEPQSAGSANSARCVAGPRTEVKYFARSSECAGKATLSYTQTDQCVRSGVSIVDENGVVLTQAQYDAIDAIQQPAMSFPCGGNAAPAVAEVHKIPATVSVGGIPVLGTGPELQAFNLPAYPVPVAEVHVTPATIFVGGVAVVGTGPELQRFDLPAIPVAKTLCELTQDAATSIAVSAAQPTDEIVVKRGATCARVPLAALLTDVQISAISRVNWNPVTGQMSLDITESNGDVNSVSFDVTVPSETPLTLTSSDGSVIIAQSGTQLHTANLSVPCDAFKFEKSLNVNVNLNSICQPAPAPTITHLASFSRDDGHAKTANYPGFVPFPWFTGIVTATAGKTLLLNIGVGLIEWHKLDGTSGGVGSSAGLVFSGSAVLGAPILLSDTNHGYGSDGFQSTTLDPAFGPLFLKHLVYAVPVTASGSVAIGFSFPNRVAGDTNGHIKIGVSEFPSTSTITYSGGAQGAYFDGSNSLLPSIPNYTTPANSITLVAVAPKTEGTPQSWFPSQVGPVFNIATAGGYFSEQAFNGSPLYGFSSTQYYEGLAAWTGAGTNNVTIVGQEYCAPAQSTAANRATQVDLRTFVLSVGAAPATAPVSIFDKTVELCNAKKCDVLARFVIDPFRIKFNLANSATFRIQIIVDGQMISDEQVTANQDYVFKGMTATNMLATTECANHQIQIRMGCVTYQNVGGDTITLLPPTLSIGA